MQSQFFQIPCYFELIWTISLGFALQSSTIGYFELSLFRTAFRFPWEFEIGVVNNLVLIWQEHNVSTILSTYNSILILLADSYNCQYLTVLTVWVIYASKSNREKKKNRNINFVVSCYQKVGGVSRHSCDTLYTVSVAN